MSQTGLGPGIGEMFWVAPASSATSQFRTQLQRWGVEQDYKIYTLPSLAYADMIAGRNDVMLVMPGSYTETVRIAWSKDWTHLVGLGGPNVEGDHSLPGVTIYNASLNQAETIDITGDRCQFQNVFIGNGGADADNLTAVNVDGWGCYFKNVKFMGIISDLQVATAGCSSLSIDTLGHFPLFEDCIIGQNNWNVRTETASGHLNFRATSDPDPQNGTFRRCKFLSRSDTAAVAMVYIQNAQDGMDRTWLFEDCVFTNFSSGLTTTMTQVFEDNLSGAHQIVLKDCVAQGYARWQTADQGANWFGTNQANAGTGGGIVLNASGD